MLRDYKKLDVRKGVIGTKLISEAAFQGFLRYLNDSKTAESKRIVGVLEDMQAIERTPRPVFDNSKLGVPPDEALVRYTRSGRKVPHRKIKNMEEWAQQAALDARCDALNRELAKYSFHPRLTSWPGPFVQWTIDWIWRSSGARSPYPFKFNDPQAMQLIFDLAVAGYLNRVRRCGHCQRWFYAKLRTQKFCSFKCQQKDYTQSPEWKEHRRRYMREYYRRNF